MRLKKLARAKHIQKIASEMDSKLETLRQELTQIETDTNLSEEERDAKLDEWIERYHQAADEYFANRQNL
jgi:hypothetical protein